MLQTQELVPDHQASQTLQNHLRAFFRGDVDAFMSDYSKHAVLFAPNAVLRGSDEVRRYFEELLVAFPPGSTHEVKQTATDDDLAYLVWAGESDALHIPLATETLLIRQGLIMRHSFAARMEAKG